MKFMNQAKAIDYESKIEDSLNGGMRMAYAVDTERYQFILWNYFTDYGDDELVQSGVAIFDKYNGEYIPDSDNKEIPIAFRFDISATSHGERKNRMKCLRLVRILCNHLGQQDDFR